MRPQHFLMFALALVVGYGLGVKFPSVGTAALSKVGA